MKITVFTPTYNRGYIIENAYRSLCRQTCKDFEWIVVDDGSLDNTSELFEEWRKQDNGFQICYIKQSNGGKMRAANLGASLARGELFLNLDSDDYLTDDAIATIISWEATISDKKSLFAGVAGQKCHFDGSPIGSSFNGESLDASVLERDKYGICGDKAEIFYTSLLRKYRFPEIEGEKFISEGITWMEICFYEKKILRWFNKPICKCEYIEDGYSAHSWEISVKNPQGVLCNCNKLIKITQPSFAEKMRIWHKYYLVAKFNGYTNRKIRNDLSISWFYYALLTIGHHVSRIRKKVD